MNKVIITGVLATALTGCMHTSEGLPETGADVGGVQRQEARGRTGVHQRGVGSATAMTKSYTPLANGGSISLDLPTMLDLDRQ